MQDIDAEREQADGSCMLFEVVQRKLVAPDIFILGVDAAGDGVLVYKRYHGVMFLVGLAGFEPATC